MVGVGSDVKPMIVYTLFEGIVYTFSPIKHTPFNPWITVDQVRFSCCYHLIF